MVQLTYHISARGGIGIQDLKTTIVTLIVANRTTLRRKTPTTGARSSRSPTMTEHAGPRSEDNFRMRVHFPEQIQSHSEELSHRWQLAARLGEPHAIGGGEAGRDPPKGRRSTHSSTRSTFPTRNTYDSTPTMVIAAM